jgi:ATP-dependent Clp protease protease subunit
MELPNFDDRRSDFRSRLHGRLMDARTVMVSRPITTTAAGRLTEQLAVMDADADDPIRMVFSHVPGGEASAGLSVHDFVRALDAPVVVLATGRVVGPGVLAFLGAAADRRYVLPNARLRLEEPSGPGGADSPETVQQAAQELADLRRRAIDVVAGATGQAADAVATDLANRRAVGAQEAVEYGLACRVVERASDIQ